VVITETPIAGVLLIEPKVHRDDRGFFLESFQSERFRGAGLPDRFVQDNHSRSTRGVLRGMHYQLRRPQGKLVTAVRGEVFDVALDIRRGSPTFGQWYGTTLSGDAPRFLYLPPGLAHGFCVLSDVADFVYKCTEPYDPADDHGVLWSDPGSAIAWPIGRPTVSPKDERYLPLDAARGDLPDFKTP
jgi:dTDP-4-dehydrorhamnose 3,5-epimerase